MPRLPALLILVALILPAPAIAGSLSREIDSALANQALSGAVTGVEVADVQTGKILYEHDAATRLMPASNRKLFTSAAALELLGDDYVLRTTVVAQQKPDSTGTIAGDLYLKGGGDALLAPADIDQFVKSLAGLGVKHIAGDIMGDGSFFQGNVYPDGWEVGYLSDYYAAQVAGLQLAEGNEVVHVDGGAKPGDPVAVATFPATGYMTIDNSAVTGAAGSSLDVDIYRPYDKNEIVVSGTVPPGYKSTRADGIVTVDNPPLYAATYFLEDLRRAGIQVDGSATTGLAPASGVVLAEHDSVPMAQYIRLMNKPSDNLMAESLLRTLGAVKGTSGDYWSGHAVEQSFFEKQMGVVPYDLSLYDGSGLSRQDLVTARAVVSVLTHMAHEPDFKTYYDSLPIAGVDGTLRGRFKGTIAAGKVHAKTGYVGACRTLSGYVTTLGGRILAFSLLMNNYVDPTSQINGIQDKIVLLLANEK